MKDEIVSEIESEHLLEPEQSNLNALLIPSITERILSLCENEELKACRLVCHEWNIEAWKYLRKRSQIIFQTQEKIQEFLEHSHTSFADPINYKLGSPLELENEWVKNLFLSNGEIIQYLYLDRVYWDYSTLWDLLGKRVPNLTELKLCFNHEPSVQNLRAMPHLHLPKLTSLSINCNLINDPSCQLLLRILAAATNINTLSSLQCAPAFPISSRQIDFRMQRLARPRRGVPVHYHLHNPRNEMNITHFLEKFATSNSSRFGDLILSQMLLNHDSIELDKLTTLNMELIIIENNDLVKLSKKKFPLQKLTIVLCGGNIRTGVLHEALKNFRDSLTFLRINHLNKHLLCSTFSTNAIPSSFFMKKLTKIQLEEYTGNIFFMTSVAMLKELIISNSDFSNILHPWKHSALKIYAPHDLQCLTVENNTVKICMAKTVISMCQRFPHLNKLTLGHMTDESIRVIFGQLHALIEFTATEGFFTDSGITGIPAVDINKLKDLALTDQRVKSLRIHPYIGNLKELRIVTLESAKLSEISLLFGIAFCPRIKKISLVNPKKVQQEINSIIEFHIQDRKEEHDPLLQGVEVSAEISFHKLFFIDTFNFICEKLTRKETTPVSLYQK